DELAVVVAVAGGVVPAGFSLDQGNAQVAHGSILPGSGVVPLRWLWCTGFGGTPRPGAGGVSLFARRDVLPRRARNTSMYCLSRYPPAPGHGSSHRICLPLRCRVCEPAGDVWGTGRKPGGLSKALQTLNGRIEGRGVLGEAQAGQALAGGWVFVERGQGDGCNAVFDGQPATERGVVQVADGGVVHQLEVAARDVQRDQPGFEQPGAEAVAFFLVEGAELFIMLRFGLEHFGEGVLGGGEGAEDVVLVD